MGGVVLFKRCIAYKQEFSGESKWGFLELLLFGLLIKKGRLLFDVLHSCSHLVVTRVVSGGQMGILGGD